MIDIKISLCFGAFLMIAGGWLVRWHWRTWGEQHENSQISERERHFYRLQFRRRMQVALLLIVLGILIPLLDFMTFKNWPRLFTALACGMLIATVWIMLLAAIDWLASRVINNSSGVTPEMLAQKRKEIEAELDRIRRDRSGGESS